MKRHPVRLLVLAAASAITALALTAPAQAASTPYCGITWGSLAKSAGNSTAGGPGTELAAVRTGRHACYDRLVLDIGGTTHVNSWRVTTSMRSVPTALAPSFRCGAARSCRSPSARTTTRSTRPTRRSWRTWPASTRSGRWRRRAASRASAASGSASGRDCRSGSSPSPDPATPCASWWTSRTAGSPARCPAVGDRPVQPFPGPSGRSSRVRRGGSMARSAAQRVEQLLVAGGGLEQLGRVVRPRRRAQDVDGPVGGVDSGGSA